MTREPPVLTMRQTEVAMLVAEGMDSHAIGRRLGLTFRTVQTYIEQAALRLDGDGPPRDKLAAWALALRADVAEAAWARIPPPLTLRAERKAA